MSVEQFYVFSVLLTCLNSLATVVGWLVTFLMQVYVARQQRKAEYKREIRELLMHPRVEQLNGLKDWLEFPFNVMAETDLDTISKRKLTEWEKDYGRYATLAGEYDTQFAGTKNTVSLVRAIISVNDALLDWQDALKGGAKPEKALDHLNEVATVIIPMARRRIEDLKMSIAKAQ